MAFRFSSFDDELAETHEINVTPFIDVILVLLIIFMVAAPLSTVAVDIDLPIGSTAENLPSDKPVLLTIKPDLSLVLDDMPIVKEDLRATLTTVMDAQKDQRIFIQADKHVAYGDVMEMMNFLRVSGYSRIALVGQGTTSENTRSDSSYNNDISTDVER